MTFWKKLLGHAPARTSGVASRRVTAAAPVRVSYDVVPLWHDRGWQETEPGLWQGAYQAPTGDCEGYIVDRGDDTFHAGLLERPHEVDHHPHRSCLMSDRTFGEYW